ncbi:MAG: PH domain-containing protein [Paludisphaera borealis]|uniref:PH domain-containing protein n=1 Tax=Paludisphaera borealis TaxID=1387353 RepID=UPI0028441137|nr:PH domain-containing protein [Paludisphaera borealis]MDR3620406.1 PH domain-containing protein [Paludisphaera borealis]
MSEGPLLVVRPVPVLRQFWLVGGIHSAGIALFVGFLALVVLKFGADAVTGSSGDTNLPFALAWAATASGVAFLALWAFHYKAFVRDRGATTYTIYADRIEAARDGSARPSLTVPLDRVVDVHSTAGPLLRPVGLATITVVADQPTGRSGPKGRLWVPFPNVPEPDEVCALIRSLIPASRRSA